MPSVLLRAAAENEAACIFSLPSGCPSAMTHDSVFGIGICDPGKGVSKPTKRSSQHKRCSETVADVKPAVHVN